MDNHRDHNLAILTDVAPFRALQVLICRKKCKSSGDHHPDDDEEECIPLPDELGEVVAMPHSRRRSHLHHSYDPAMKHGERHQHRWARVTAADLIDEGLYKHSGSLHVITTDVSKLASSYRSIVLDIDRDELIMHKALIKMPLLRMETILSIAGSL